MKNTLKTFPLLPLTYHNRKINEIRDWKQNFEAELPSLFDKIRDKIDWILSYREVASKLWFLEQLESFYTFIELREKEILGE